MKEMSLLIKTKKAETRQKETTEKGISQSTIFSMKYWMIFAVLAFSSLLLMKMPIVQHLANITFKNWLMLPIVGLSIIGIAGSILLSLETGKEAKLVEKMVANQDRIDFLEAEIPAEEFFGRSSFVSHFRKLVTSKNLAWTNEARSNLEGYLEEKTFQAIKLFDFLEDLLPLLGLLGTAIGLAEATLSKVGGTSMLSGVGNAIGTTVFALWARVFISTLNQIIVSEKRLQLKTVLVLFRITENGRRP